MHRDSMHRDSMHRDSTVCPHCLARGAPAGARSADGLVTCHDCRGPFAVKAGGVVALPLPDHVIVEGSRTRFAVVIRGFFVTFGSCTSNLIFALERDRFSWPEPGDLGPLRFQAVRRVFERAAIDRFAWRRFTRRAGGGALETVSDLVLVGRRREDTRIGFAFPARFAAGTSIATLLGWAHETWFDGEGSAYRKASREPSRPPLSILRRSGVVEPLIRPTG